MNSTGFIDDLFRAFNRHQRLERGIDKGSRQEEKDGNDQSLLTTKGGIDLNPNSLDLQTQGEGMDFDFFFESQDLENIEQIPLNGLTPVIFNITPVSNLPLLLGLEMEPSDEMARVE